MMLQSLSLEKFLSIHGRSLYKRIDFIPPHDAMIELLER